MIKILFFIENLSEGGAEKVLCELVNHMDQSQFDITVQTLWPVRRKSYLVPGIKYKSVYPKRSRYYQYLMRLETALQFIYPLHIKGDYDIEVAYLECGATKIISQSTNKHAKKIAWVHCDLAVMSSDPSTFANKTKSYYQKYDHIVCVSEKTRESFESMYGKQMPVSVIHNVIDDDAIRLKSEQPIPELFQKRRTTVAAVGRLAPPKNYMRLLTAHKRLLNDGVEHDVWIVGEGTERPGLEKYIRENDLGSTVTLIGFQNNPYPFIRTADVLACSSNYEGFSTVVTEGLVIGKPIVTTNCSGMHELLGNNEYGLITENDDEAFYLGMKQMLENEAVREMYHEKAATRAKYFSTQMLVKENEAFFLRMLN